jgi:hypothetical protein
MDESRWVDVAYEELVASPVVELRRVYGELGLAFTRDAESNAAALADKRARTTLTAPRAEKWRDQNPDAVARILPQLADIEQRLGYQ